MSSNKSVSSTATARLKQDYSRLMKDPVPYVTACPLPSNILEWYYVVKGKRDALVFKLENNKKKERA